MLDTLRRFFARVGRFILSVLLRIGHWLGAPFRWLGRWFQRRRLWIRIAAAVILLPWLIGYLHFIWNAAFIRGFDPDWPERLNIAARQVAPGRPLTAQAIVAPTPAPEIAPEPNAPAGGAEPVPTPAPAVAAAPACGRSYIVDAAVDVIDLNVNRTLWISSNPFYKMGFIFLLDWDRTKFFDNKAAFQRGAHQAVSRTVNDLTDVLGRVRGTSEVDPDLTIARGNLQFDQYTWAFNPFSDRPFGPTTRSSTYYRGAAEALQRYQARLAACAATFDERADNLLQFIDRVAADIGSMSASLMERAESHNSGWFDTRADDLFHSAKGQIYAYYGILSAARADFAEVVQSRELTGIWNNMELHLRRALGLRPLIVSNGAEDGLVMPSHLTSLGFYLLRARSNLVELRSVLDR